MIYSTCNAIRFGLAWMVVGFASLVLQAQDSPAVAVEAQIEDRLVNSPAALPLRATHRFEKAFLVRACELSDEQKREVEKLDDSWKTAIPKQENEAAGRQVINGGVIVLQGGLPGNFMVRARGKTDAIEDAVRKYRASLRKKLSGILSPVQRDIYEKELQARDDFKRQADAEVLVAVLNHVLGLQPEQREGLTKTLAQWPDNQNIYASYYLQNEGILPLIPDGLLSKHLNAEQLSVYRQARKSDARMNPIVVDRQQEPFGE